MKAKEVILLLFIIASGVLFHHIYTGKIDIYWDWDNDFVLFGKEHQFEETLTLEAPLGGELQVHNPRGDIIIEGTDAEDISVLLKKNIVHRDESEAAALAGKAQIRRDQTESRIILSFDSESVRKKRIRTDWKIILPKGMVVVVQNSYGLVRVSDVGRTDISNRHGRVLAVNIAGDVNIRNSYADIDIRGVDGSCSLDSRHSAILVEDISGEVLIRNDYGKINLESVEKAATIESTHSEVWAEKIAGLLSIESTYRKIDLTDVGPVKISARNCPIHIKGAEGSIFIKDSYKHVHLEDISGDLAIEGRNLSISAAQVIGEKIDIQTSYRDIELKEFSGDTTVTLSNGDIYMSPNPLTHSIRVNGSYADIIMDWPPGHKYYLKAECKGGNIVWDLPDTLSTRRENGTTFLEAFEDLQETPSIFLTTKYGKIHVGIRSFEDE